MSLLKAIKCLCGHWSPNYPAFRYLTAATQPPRADTHCSALRVINTAGWLRKHHSTNSSTSPGQICGAAALALSAAHCALCTTDGTTSSSVPARQPARVFPSPRMGCFRSCWLIIITLRACLPASFPSLPRQLPIAPACCAVLTSRHYMPARFSVNIALC